MLCKFAGAVVCAALAITGLTAQTLPVQNAQQSNATRLARLQGSSDIAPLSRMAIAGGISTGGVNLQAAVNVQRHLNVRGVGNFFQYTDNNISTNGFTASAKVNLATAGVLLDYFPWANHGLRLSGGAEFYNQNGLSGTMVAAGGTSFTLNNETYYSSKANPVTGVADVALHSHSVNPAFSLGWGNIIPRDGHHLSFPVELGAMYTGRPQVAINFVSGQVCQDPAGTIGCQNVVGNTTVNDNLQAQVAKYQKDLDPLRFYPVLSFGVAYSFGLNAR